jgi:hypothetical protein
MNKVMARLALAATTVLLLTGVASAKHGVAASTVNLRAEANTTSEVLAKIPAGAKLEVGDCKDGWCAVTYQGKSGFSIATALDLSGKPRRMVRRLPPGIGPDDDFEPVPHGYAAPPPPVAYAPGPAYYYYGGPHWGPYWGYRGWGWGWRRW